LVHIIADVLCFENRLFPLGMGYRVCFAGGRVTPFSGFSTTNWAFEVYCVHADSLLRPRSRSRPVEIKLHHYLFSNTRWPEGGLQEWASFDLTHCHRAEV